MNICEYQAKQLFIEYGINIPKGKLITTFLEARQVVEFLNGASLVVKAQIYAGGRGKSGGIRFVKNVDEIESTVQDMLGKNLVTPQTGVCGEKINKILIEEKIVDIIKELYLAIVIDRNAESLVIVVSSAGGVDIEETVINFPEKVFKIYVEPNFYLWPFQIRTLLFNCGLNLKQVIKGVYLIDKLLHIVYEKEAILLEINPLVITQQGNFIALDGKITFDDSALNRHPEIAIFNDYMRYDFLERQAIEIGLNYIRLYGTVGTIVNGAGLAMATMDMIKQIGVEPANFLDIGGGGSEEMVAKGFEIMLFDPNVEIIIINIFGGIMRCDVIASGIVAAFKKINIKKPLVVRLEGTNVEEGKLILNQSDLIFEIANSMAELAQKIKQMVRD